MADVQQLLREYVERQQAGGSPDPSDLLDQTDGRQREELTTLIDGYWWTLATRKWDAGAARGSLSERVAKRAAESLESEEPPPARVWEDLRHRVKLTRSAVVKRLASDLGVAGKEEKVGSYYHELENGWLDAERVAPSVFDSLATVYMVSADWLRSLARAGEPGSPPTGPVLARAARVDPEYAADAEMPAPDSIEDDWDEVDRLFQGEPPGGG